MTRQVGPERFQRKSRKYGVCGLKQWRPSQKKTKAIIEDFQKAPDQEESVIRKLIALKGLKSLHDDLDDNGQRQIFKDLLLAYLKAHLPNNAFRIASTKQYIREDEACVIATRHIAAGEVINNLYGKRVPLGTDELKDMVETGIDFSVLEKTYYCPTSLLVGPIRMLNHKCIDEEAELQVMGDRFTVKVVARCGIAEGQEITINYGNDYFGNPTQGCKCTPCQKALEMAERGDGGRSGPTTQMTADVVGVRDSNGRPVRGCRRANKNVTFPVRTSDTNPLTSERQVMRK